MPFTSVTMPELRYRGLAELVAQVGGHTADPDQAVMTPAGAGFCVIATLASHASQESASANMKDQDRKAYGLFVSWRKTHSKPT